METWSVRLEDEIVRLQFGPEAVECVRAVRDGKGAGAEAAVAARLLRHGVLVQRGADGLAVCAASLYRRLLYTEYQTRVATAHGRAAEVLAETLFRGGRVPTVRVVAAAAVQLAPEVAAERGAADTSTRSAAAAAAAEAEAETRVRAAVEALVAAGVVARTALDAHDAAAAPENVVYFDGVGARADPTALALCLDRLADHDARDAETRLVADTLGPAAAAAYERLAQGESSGGSGEGSEGAGAVDALCACGFAVRRADASVAAARATVQRAVAREMVRDVVQRKLGADAALLFALVAADPARSCCCSTAVLAQRAVVSSATAAALLHRLRECGYVRGCCAPAPAAAAAEGEEGCSWWWCDGESARAVCVEELCRALVLLLARELAEEEAAAPLRDIAAPTDEQRTALRAHTDACDRATASILQLAHTLVFLTAHGADSSSNGDGDDDGDGSGSAGKMEDEDEEEEL